MGKCYSLIEKCPYIIDLKEAYLWFGIILQLINVNDK